MRTGVGLVNNNYVIFIIINIITLEVQYKDEKTLQISGAYAVPRVPPFPIIIIISTFILSFLSKKTVINWNISVLGQSSWIDFTNPEYRDWWSDQFALDKYKVIVVFMLDH